MSFTFLSHSLRQILPRKEIRERDRRSGAYPVKSKTGDRTRTGRNKVYFDDERAVLFLTGVNITYPTTLQFDPGKVAGDLTASLEATVVGSVDPYAVDQFIPHRDQNEPPRAFFDCDLFEQDETNVVNSKFMTGVAYSIAPDRFKSKLSNKTIIRKDFVLRHVSQMSTGSGIMYFNEASGCFVRKNPEYSFIANGQGLGIFTFAALPFTPYGMAYMPLNDYAVSGYGGSGYYNLPAAEASVRRMSLYAADGTDNLFFDISGFNTGFVTASLLNPGHAATNDQTVSLTNELGHPFLIEKIVVEFPFQAGPGWLNDSFRLRETLVSDLQYAADAGGPLITFAVMRQDATDLKHRDLIASGTITNALDMVTDRYTVCTGVYGGGGGYTDIVVTPDGVGGLGIIPNATITGSFLSASDNFYTGTVKMVLEPQITSHVMRTRASGSAYWFLTNIISRTTAYGAVFGSIARRSSKYLDSGRSILGNSFALLDPAKLNQGNNPINVMDSQYEDLPQKPSAPGRIARSKLYLDVKSNTIKSPYLLYPEDKLVFCLSKHRAVGDDTLADVLFNGNNSDPTSFMSYHDVAIGTGSFKITLYGDLIREDVEFHDTLNQRLETEEIWEDIGEDPVLDQFDVAYRSELSGSYIDRFTVANMLASYGTTDLSSSIQLTSYYSHFSSKLDDQTSWSTQYEWSTAHTVEVLKKNNRNVNHISLNEKFWDSRIPDPLECIKTCNPNYRLLGLDTIAGNTISFVLYTGDAAFAHDTAPQETGRGIKDWMMTYPYDQRYQGLTQKFSNTLTRDFMIRKDPGSAGTFGGVTPYKALSMEIGHNGSNGIHRRVCAENDTNFSLGHIGLTTSEFIKAFYGIGDGKSNVDNQHVTFRRGVSSMSQSVVIRGWRHGMMSAFPLRPRAVYRRDHFGQPRDLLEQRLDAKFFDELGLSPDGSSNGVVGVKTGPVQVYFYDSAGKQTDALKTLSSNVSFEATSSVPYFDGSFRNRPAYDFSTLNIKSVII